MTKTILPVRDMCVIGIFAALTGVLSQIAIPLPFTPIPFSMGMVAVFVSGMLLRPKCAVFTQVCYLALGAVGIPVFTGFRGGVGALFGPTGGYLFAYPVMAAVIAVALNYNGYLPAVSSRGKWLLSLKAAGALLLSVVILYLCGTRWFSFTTGNTFAQALALTALPFVPMDLVKIALCVLGVLPVRERMAKAGLLV